MFVYGMPGHTTYRQIAAPARAAVSDVAGCSQRRPHAVVGRSVFAAAAESQSWHCCGHVGPGRVDARGLKVHCWLVVHARAGRRAVAPSGLCRKYAVGR